MNTKTTPVCPYCNQEFAPGVYWKWANYCRAAYLIMFIDSHPNLSAWEMHQQTGMPYKDVTGGLQKAREWQIVVTEDEQREQGGKRFRYFAVDNWKDTLTAWENRGYV